MFQLLRNLFAKPQVFNQKKPNEVSEITNFTSKDVFHGDLSVITIDNLMQLMSHAGLTGELCLTTHGNNACFIINNGSLIFGHMEKKFQRTGERLVQAGYVTKEKLQECLLIHQKKDGSQRLGELLIEKQYVLSNHLEEIIKEQVKDCFFQVLSWNQGTFNFFVNDRPHDENLILDERIDHLIIEGVVKMDHNS